VQEPGEHPYCGDGIVGNCGFTYDPEKLFANNIQFFNYSWEDMETTTNELMMKIMNVFALTFRSNDKILVHCHAGKGRTLMAICSWLIYG
jgi:protein-tyrosine phosphatase